MRRLTRASDRIIGEHAPKNGGGDRGVEVVGRALEEVIDERLALDRAGHHDLIRLALSTFAIPLEHRADATPAVGGTCEDLVRMLAANATTYA